jgi:hypothetical protein
VTRALLLWAAVLLVPATANAGRLAAPYAEAVLDPVDSYVGGTVRGPESSRATWLGLGEIDPFSGPAMAVFSTGELEVSPIPGTDLGAVGPAVDNNIQLDLVLAPPQWARSLRFAYALIAPADFTEEQASAIVDDACTVTVSTQIGLDPWTLAAPIGPLSAAFEQGPQGALDDVAWLEGTRATGWIEAIVPIRPELGNITFSFGAYDGGEDPLYDIICLLDGVAFDRGIPVGVSPGVIPRVDRVSPGVTPEGREVNLVVEGRDLPIGVPGLLDTEVEFSILDPSGIVEHVVTPLDAIDGNAIRSTERVVLPIPPLDGEGTRGLRIAWPGGAMSWTAAFEVRNIPPRIERVRPRVGPPEGGNRIAIEGSGFYDVTSVEIGGRSATADDIVVLSPQHLEVLVPGPGTEVGIVDIIVTARGLITTAPDAYTISATEAQTAETEDSGPVGPSTGCNQAAAPSMSLMLLPVLVRRRRHRGAASV